MRRNSAEETIQDKEDYERLAANHGARVFTYRSYNRIFAYSLFKGAVQNCGQETSYCGLGSHYQHVIVESIIK